jgi:hypothetical protein
VSRQRHRRPSTLLLVSLGLAVIGVGGLIMSATAFTGIWNSPEAKTSPEAASHGGESSTASDATNPSTIDSRSPGHAEVGDAAGGQDLPTLQRQLLDRDLELADLRAAIAQLKQQRDQERAVLNERLTDQQRKVERLSEQLQASEDAAELSRAANTLLKQQLAANRRVLNDRDHQLQGQREVSQQLRQQVVRAEQLNRQLEQRLADTTVVARPTANPQPETASSVRSSVRSSVDYDDTGWVSRLGNGRRGD